MGKQRPANQLATSCTTCDGSGEVREGKASAVKARGKRVGFTEEVFRKCPECKGKGDRFRRKV